jgi:hypothetical protein
MYLDNLVKLFSRIWPGIKAIAFAFYFFPLELDIPLKLADFILLLFIDYYY